MSATLLAALGLSALFLGYRFYSRFIAEEIYKLDPDFVTPAHTKRDDIDYIPTNRFVLWGHHFTACRCRDLELQRDCSERRGDPTSG